MQMSRTCRDEGRQKTVNVVLSGRYCALRSEVRRSRNPSILRCSSLRCIRVPSSYGLYAPEDYSMFDNDLLSGFPAYIERAAPRARSSSLALRSWERAMTVPYTLLNALKLHSMKEDTHPFTTVEGSLGV